MGRWKTVPSFFPEYDDLHPETQYHLREGYSVYGWELKRSGTHYQKILVDPPNAFRNALLYMGFSNWHKEWKVERNFPMRLFRKWKRKGNDE